MNTRTHPAVDVLTAYVQGRLPLDVATALDNHLSECSDCIRRLEGVGSDTFSDLLRAPTDTDMVVQAVPFPDLPHALQNHPRYEIEARLGQGGMGVVYRAKHRMMSRSVALKLIRTDLLATPLAVARFRREVQAAAKLAHPNIVTAHDAEEIGGVHFLVMEYVEGRTLDRLVSKRGPLPSPIACMLARQAALGLEHAHTHGMVHRDIKPQNLIVTDKSRLKILDFGLALWSDPAAASLTGKHATLGTMLYAAPEQIRTAGTVDGRADLYGLGATLAYLLTGEPPQQRSSEGGSVPMPDTVPPEVSAIIAKMMAQDPDDRYATAKEAAEALAPWCKSDRPDSSRKSPRRWVAIAAGVAVTGVALAYALRPPEPVPVVPASATAVEPVWTSLLPRVVPARDAVAGEWKLTHDGLTVGAVRGGRIMLPAEPTGEYDLRISFTRLTGIHSVGAVIVHRGHQVTFELDAWEQHLAGFQEVDGQSMRSNPTGRDGYELNNNQRYVLLLEVRRDSIRALLDDREVTRLVSNGSNLALNEDYWRMPNRISLGLLAWDSDVVFHSVELKTR